MYTTQEAMNIQLGHHGTAFINDTGTLKPPKDHVIVAIQITETGSTINTLTAEDNTKWLNTVAAAHDAATRTSELGEEGEEWETALTLLAGFTMYGRWTELVLGSGGSAIVYFGK